MSSSNTQRAASMASRFTNSPVLTRLRNSPVISGVKRWAAGKASPKPQPKDPNPRRYVNGTPTTASTAVQPPQKDTGETPPPSNITTNVSSNKLVKLAKNAAPRAKKMWEGFLEVPKGTWSVLQNPKFQSNYYNFIKSMGLILLAMYSVLGLLTVIYFPVAIFLASWAPGFIGQILTLIPLWSYNIARKRNPAWTNKLFLDELEVLSSQRAKEVGDQIKEQESYNRNWVQDTFQDLRTSWHFTRYSLLWLSFSIIPVVGSFITWFGQTWLVADKLGWNLLSVYTISAKKMSYRQQKHWMRARKWRIIGFTLPYVLLSSIPIVGPLFLGLAQGATAHIYYHLLSKDVEGEKAVSSPLIQFKKPT